MKVLFISLGCDKNLVDSEEMLGLLTANGYQITWDRIPCSAAYQIIEANTNRYTLTSVTSTDANVNISLRESGEKHSFQVTADLFSKKTGTCVVYTNTKDRWGDWSHTSYVKNQIQVKK